MTTKHTPGPWRIVDREIMEDGSVYPCHILGGDADHQVCTLESPDIAKHGVEQPHLFPGLNGVLGPNARLISAAPELLEAAQALINAWDQLSDTSKAHCGQVLPAVHAARRAVLAATGEKL